MILLIGLLAAGMILLLAEVILPGMVAGIIGTLCLLAAVVYAGTEFGTHVALMVFMGELIFGVIFFIVWLKFFPQSPWGKRLSLPDAENQKSSEDYSPLLGTSGTSLTPLRPSGTAIIDGRRVDVVTEGVLLPAGENITVVKVEGARILVRQSTSTPQTSPKP